MINGKILKVIRYKAGFEVRTELHLDKQYGKKCITIRFAYNLNGDYIGTPKVAFRLYRKFGVVPEKADIEHSVCSVGFSKKRKKWYGWSHRAICGFGVGDIVKKGDCCNSSGWTEDYLKQHPEKDKSLPVGFKAKILDDCKRMAIAFAESVS